MRIVLEDARDALFVHGAQIQRIPEPGFHPGEDSVSRPCRHHGVTALPGSERRRYNT